MKQIIRKLTAITAAAITAVSALSATGLTASAYDVTNSNYLQLQNQYNGNGAGQYWNTPATQQGLPQFTSAFMSRFPSGVTVKYKGENNKIMGTLAENLTKTGGSNDYAKTQSYVDKISCKDWNNNSYALDLVYEESYHPQAPNDFALRMLTPGNYYLNSYLNQIELEEFNLNANTGAYTGTLSLEDHYLAGMSVSCSDGRTTFSKPVLTTDEDEFCIYTKIHFSGTLPFKPNSLYFTSGQCCTILNNLKITFNGCGQNFYTTNAFKRIYNKSTNSLYAGDLDGNTLKTEISGQTKTNFNNNKFVCAKSAGNTLYIYIGKNTSVPDSSWNTGWGEAKLNAFLNSTGWKDGFKHNTWIVNWLNSHNNSNCTVKFMYDCTTSNTGNMFYNCTASYFRNTKLGL